MDQIQKFGLMLWAVKEKIVLACLVAILSWQVYKVVMSANGADAGVSVGPVTPPKPELTDLQAIGAESPGPPPEPIRVQEFTALVRRNPFTVYGNEAGESSGSTQVEEKLDLTLERIVPWRDNTVRAQIRTKTSRAEPYYEGQSVEDFRVDKIDAEKQEVTIFSFKHQKQFVLKVGQTS
ncbi:MAG: hypothetical protein AMXMBFR84_02380 [Candidatus Hydrogenedentota bacterium]